MPTARWDSIDPSDGDAEQVLAAYVAAIDAAGEHADTTQLAVQNDEGGQLAVTAAAEVLASTHTHLGPRAIREELLDRLLIAMSNAVVDVDRLAQTITLDLDAKELQQRIEGRVPMTIEEYAHIRHAIAVREM